MLLATAIDEYLTYTATYLQTTSQRVYRNRLHFLKRQFADREVESISRQDIDQAVLSYRETRSNNTVRLFVTCTRQLFAWCVDEGYIARSPASRLRKPRTPHRTPRSLRDPLVDELLHKLKSISTRKWHDRRNVAIVLFVLNTGLRRGEIIGLRWQDVDWEAGYVRVLGKGERERIVPLNPAAKDALLIVWGEREHVFGRLDGGKMNGESLDVVIKRWVEYHGLPSFGLHKLRHTFATRLLARGVDIYDIRDLLGHSSVSTTEIYLSANPERLRGAVEKL